MTHKKANKSKILALILGLTMCLALMLGIVFASPTFAVYAEGATGGLTIDGTVDIAADGTYAYSIHDKTLRLNGYSGGVIRFTADDDVKVNLENGSTNTITLNDSAVTENQYGVYAAGNLTVTGKGTLNINLNKRFGRRNHHRVRQSALRLIRQKPDNQRRDKRQRQFDFKRFFLRYVCH